MALRSGDIVGAYEILDPLGVGGMASVYRARHTVLGSEHALKVLKGELVQNAGLRQRFLDEGRVQAQLRHPGIVRVTGIVSEPGVAGLVMDLLLGSSLEDELNRGTPSPEHAAGWVLQALDAVGFAHSAGVVHRDLKPSNLFLAEHQGERTIKVLDFGIAKVGTRQTRPGGTLGTYGFMAPEQLTDASEVDARADVFALGAVLYELLTGRPAFVGDSDFELMQRVHQGTYDVEPLPEPFREVIARALCVERDQRIQSCEEFALLLGPLARTEDRRLVASWEGTMAEPPPLTRPVAPTVDVAPEPVTVDAEVVSVVPQAALERRAATAVPSEREELLVRATGAAQILTGVLNTFALWMLSCYGYPKLFAVVFGWLGLPGLFTGLASCGGVLGLGLLIVGPIEILTGIRAQMNGASARASVGRTATLQVASLAFGGVPSALVGLVTIGLLLAYPVREEA